MLPTSSSRPARSGHGSPTYMQAEAAEASQQMGTRTKPAASARTPSRAPGVARAHACCRKGPRARLS